MIIVTRKPAVAKNISTTNMEDNRGLANRMWQFAYFLAFAMEHKITLINSSFAEHAEHFEGTRQNLFCSFPQIRIPFAININWLNRIFKISLWFKRISKSLRHRMPILNNIFSFISIKEKYFNLDKKENYELITKYKIVFIEGWKIRCNRTLIRHNHAVKKYFMPRNKNIKNVESILKPIKKKHNILIGLHIRRGDYNEFAPQYYFTYEDYVLFIMKIIKYFKDENNIAFIICSDENIDQALFEQFPCYYSTGHYIEDMYILSKCNYIFGVSSTFSIWASFFGEVPLYLIDNKDLNIKKEGFKIYQSL